MIRLLLVDDSPLFCAQFRGLARWEDYGITITDEARNGRDAIACVNRELPDIILTDISMPVMDGIGLIEYVHSHYPQLPVIALSAYDDFDYVRGSLRNGACDYILKHKLDVGQLTDLIRGVVQSSSEQSSGTENPADSHREFFALALSGWFADPEETERRMEKLKISFPADGCVPVLAGIDPRSDGRAEFTEPMIQLLLECLNRRIWEYMLLKEDRMLLMIPASNSAQLSGLVDTLRAAAVTVGRFFGAGLSFCTGNICRDMAQLADGTADLQEQYDTLRFLDRTGFLTGPDSNTAEEAMHLSREEEHRLSEELSHGNRDGVLMCLRGIFDDLRSRAGVPKDLSLLYPGLISILIRADRDGMLQDIHRQAPDFHDYDSIRDMQRWCESAYAEAADRIREREGHGYNEYVQQIIQFIRSHYAERITLKDIALAVGLSESYVSRIFKNETGVNIVTYINNIRLDEAARLLRQTGLPIKVIADRVGIESYNRFFDLFRERKGCTPRAFRDRKDETAGE